MIDAQSRADHARRLLADEMLVEVLDAIEQAAVDAWKRTGLAQEVDRERVWHSFKASQRVRSTLEGIRDNGLIEASRASAVR